MDSYSIGEVARMAGVTVRTLHHYDELGLVVPDRSANGYRTYGRRQLEQLQHVRFFRTLEFPLGDIQRIMTDPTFDRSAALHKQRELMVGRIEELSRVLGTIDRAIDHEENGTTMTDHDMFAEEARQRWGDTEAYKISEQRVAGYSSDDMERAKAEADSIAQRLAEAMKAGEPADGDVAVALAEEHRLHIDGWFYPCSHEAHANLGDLYVADHRFTEWWDRFGEGTAEYARDAIVANGLRHVGA